MQTSLEAAAEVASTAIGAFRDAAMAHAECVDRLATLQRERPQQKLDALTRLCGQINPASQKNYTITQADDLLQLDPEYAAYRLRVTEAEAAAREAEDEKLAARLEAELQTVLVKALAGVM